MDPEVHFTHFLYILCYGMVKSDKGLLNEQHKETEWKQ